MWFSYYSGTIFEHFGRWNISWYLGGVLGGSGGGFLRHFGPDLVDFEGSERSQISSSKLEAEKVVSGPRGGVWGSVLAAQVLIVDQSIIDNIHRRSLTSFIVGHSNR